MKDGNVMGTSYQDSHYRPLLAEALEFQDYVAEKLYETGLPLFNYASKKYQFERGENKLGVEIKKDRKFATTRNLWIEISEKSDPSKECYVTSGIRRNDNTWLYVIGDERTIFIFSKRFLVKLLEAKKYKVIENSTKTSKGFLFPEVDARKYAAKIIEVSE